MRSSATSLAWLLPPDTVVDDDDASLPRPP